ncbi:MAG TPA: hypothetical protein VMT42_01695 [candidate division Zixibacteria bacterium]|nr:hypothetical protein [candidate division Zixibacteria bacterium]
MASPGIDSQDELERILPNDYYSILSARVQSDMGLKPKGVKIGQILKLLAIDLI